jgi:hypothetical protein
MSSIARPQMAKIVLLCTFATIAHPPLFHTTSPALLGLCWGIAASIGPGAIVGVLLALVSQSSGFPPTPIRPLLITIGVLIAIMAASATLAGIVGHELSRRSIIALPASFSELVPIGQQDRFMAVWFAHAASYLIGFIGSSLILWQIWRKRGKPRVLTVLPRTKGGIIRVLILAAITATVVLLRFAGQ